jgi:hypothetical protein
MSDDHRDYEGHEMTLHKASQLSYHLARTGYHYEAALAMLAGSRAYLDAVETGEARMPRASPPSPAIADGGRST